MGRKHSVVIVGAGLFGSIAAKLARAAGHRVTVVDGQMPWAASKASGCVLAPSWLSSMPKVAQDTALGVLRDLYTVHDMEFTTNLGKRFRAQRVDAMEVSEPATVQAEVAAVNDGEVVLADGRKIRGKVLVAAGIGSSKLVAMPAIRELWGASLLVRDQIESPRIYVYAPYRQAVAFNKDNKTVWMGDGTALIAKTWMLEGSDRVEATRARAASYFHLNVQTKVKVNQGARPYVEGHKAGYFARISPNTWVSTGGAKNGTVLAAWQAHQFVQELS